MKKIILLLFIAVVSLAGTAQTTIGNATMENWTGSGPTTEPQYWNSIKTGAGNSLAISFAPQSCFQEGSNPHTGTYCARILTGSALGQVAPGSLTTGQVTVPSLTATEGYIRTVPGDPNFSMSFIGRPDSLIVWYRYSPQGVDYPSITALLHVGNAYLPEVPVNGNHPDSSMNIIARAEWEGANTSVSSWARLAIPFIYVDARIPQYILITLTSTANSGGTANSTFWVDDFDVIYNPTIATGTISPLSYYISATTGANVSVPFVLTGTYNGGNTVTAQLSDASGSFASPTVIGSLATTTSGTISATIPANTATGTGYRIRVVSSNPLLTAADNGADISITLVGNSIAPSTPQTIAANVDGTQLTVTETPAATSREWKYSTISGSGYVSFAPSQIGTAYTPNFPGAGTYYVVCTSTYPGGITVNSNEVSIDVVANSIAPTSPQSILVGVDGTTLTVTETPIAITREWQYATVSGGAYISFVPAITGVTAYTPNFASAGNYYVVCQSLINSVTVFSNEVLISVGNATILTGTVIGSPFLFSPSAPDASVSVPFTTSGTFNGPNVFTAQLSDANGSFSNPVDIGTLAATASGSISATVPHTTTAGTGYRIRVISNDPVVLGSDNGTDLAVDQFDNSIAPAVTQTIQHSTNGTAITVTASQTATHEWKYSTTSGSGYVSFVPVEPGSSYTPNFPVPGAYYVVCVSTNTYTDAVTSNEVQINVANGSTIVTSAVSGSPFLISTSMIAPVSVDFTSDVVFNAGNIFKAQLSDNNGSFASPIEIGSLTSVTIGTISATIPTSSVAGSGFRIRVVSTDPAVTGSDNGTNLQIVPFETSISPIDTQYLLQGQNGNAISVTETHTATRVWKYSQASGLGYVAFNPAETGVSVIPHFNLVSPYYIICESTNSANDKLTSQEVVVIVTAISIISENSKSVIKAYWNGNDFIADLSSADLSSPVLELMNVNGQVVIKEKLNSSLRNSISTNLSEGVYVFRITDGGKVYSGKTSKK